MPEQWHYFYINETGFLDFESSEIPIPLDSKYSVVTLPQRVNLREQMWDESSRSFIPRPPKVVLDNRQANLLDDPRLADLLNDIPEDRKQEIVAVIVQLIEEHQ